MKKSKIKSDQYDPVILNKDIISLQFGSTVEEQGYNDSAVKIVDTKNMNNNINNPPDEELYNNLKLYKKGIDNLLNDSKRK